MTDDRTTDGRAADDGRAGQDPPMTTPPEHVRWPDPDEWGRVAPPGAGPPPGPLPVGGDDPPWPQRPDGWRHDAPDPPDAFPVPWAWTDGLFLVAWFLVAQVIVATVALAIGVDPFAQTSTLFAIVAVSHTTALVGALVWLTLRGSLSWRLLGPLRPRWLRHSLVGTGIGVSGWLIVTLLLALVVQAIDRDALPTQESLELLAEGDGLTLALGVVAAVILAPIVEEIIYRGVLFQGLRERIGLWPGMVISAALFGAMHLDTVLQPDGFDPAGFIPMLGIVLLGIWLAAAFHKSGSIVVPIVGHAVFNAIAIGLSIVSMGADDIELPTGLVGPLVRALLGT